MTDTTTDETTQAATDVAPDDEIPLFEGVRPSAVVTKAGGATERIQRPLRNGERVTVVGEAEVAGVSFTRTKSGIQRVHTLKITDLFEVATIPGRRFVNTIREQWRFAHPGAATLEFETGADAALVADGSNGSTDSSGVALTPSDRAELGLDDESRDPVIVTFENGDGARWPEDWPVDAQRPAAGDRIPVPTAKGKGKGDPVLVVEVADEGGYVLEEWTDEDEERRLAELESAAEADEEES